MQKRYPNWVPKSSRASNYSLSSKKFKIEQVPDQNMKKGESSFGGESEADLSWVTGNAQGNCWAADKP